jgi:hypothetical protein
MVCYNSFPQKPSFDLKEISIQAREYAGCDNGFLEHLNTILNNEEFRRSPRGYLDDRINNRGFTFEDRARGFFEIVLNIPTPRQSPFDLGGILEKAQEYARDDQALLKFINEILNDEQFQSYPSGFLYAWNKMQSGHDVIREPDDKAFYFLSINFLHTRV